MKFSSNIMLLSNIWHNNNIVTEGNSKHTLWGTLLHNFLQVMIRLVK